MSKPATKFVFEKSDKGLFAFMETERLIIRSLSDGDFDCVVRLQSNEEVMRFVGVGGARDEARIKEGFDSYRALWISGNPVSAYMIFQKKPDGSEGEFCGMAALETIKTRDGDVKKIEPGKAEVMLYFMPKFWGKKLGKEVLRGFFDMLSNLHSSGFPFQVEGKPLTKLIATASPGNTDSIELQRKSGFKEIETKDVKKGDKFVPKTFFEFDLSAILSPSTAPSSVGDADKVAAVIRSKL
jgi:RimJ/RimL family protein N-acetyltransferase